MKILLAIDDELFGSTIVDFVCRHSWPAETVIRVLHIQGWTPPEGELLKSRTLMEYLETQYQSASQLVSQLADRLRAALPDVDVQTEIMEGQPARRIIATATAWGADLLIVGSHARNELSRFFMGSVSLAVLSNAPCSVMVVRLPERTAEAEPESIAESVVSGAGRN